MRRLLRWRGRAPPPRKAAADEFQGLLAVGGPVVGGIARVAAVDEGPGIADRQPHARFTETGVVVAVFPEPEALVEATDPFDQLPTVEAAPEQAGAMAALKSGGMSKAAAGFHPHCNAAGDRVNLRTHSEQVAKLPVPPGRPEVVMVEQGEKVAPSRSQAEIAGCGGAPARAGEQPQPLVAQREQLPSGIG